MAAWPRHLYSLAYYGLLPFILLRLWYRGRKSPGYRRRWKERFGYIPALTPGEGKTGVIWVHAVSVGETLAAVPLIRELQHQHPGHRLAVTTTTPTGSERVKAEFGESVYHVYAPYDLPGAVSRALDMLNPTLLIVMETELWPNLIHGCYKRQIPVAVANARLSERSATGYGGVPGLSRPMLGEVSKIAVQTLAERQRFIALGAAEQNIEVTGNIKFDIRLSDEIRQQALGLKALVSTAGKRPVLLAASTHRGEDEVLLYAYAALQREFENLLLIIAPRHPERFADVAALAVKQGYSLARRSAGELPGEQHQVFLCDTMGELMLFYGICDVAFVGGSLVPAGGHNMVEPAAWGVPVISGPHLFNFTEASELLLAKRALEICHTGEDIALALEPLLSDPSYRNQRGQAALAVLQDNQGALQRLVAIIGQLLQQT